MHHEITNDSIEVWEGNTSTSIYIFPKSDTKIKLCWYLKHDWVLESSLVVHAGGSIWDRRASVVYAQMEERQREKKLEVLWASVIAVEGVNN